VTIRIRFAPNGVLTLALGLFLLAVGVLSDNAIVSLWGQVIVGAVALAWPLTLRDGLRVESGALAVSADPPTGRSGAVLAGEAVTLPLRIDNHSTRLTARLQISPVSSRGLKLEPPALPGLVGPGRGLDLALAGQALRVGPAAVHGVHIWITGPGGLFRAAVYRPLDVRIKVLPRAAAIGRRGRRLLAVAANRDAASAAPQPLRGFGSDIRELRDHQPGDPFKHIAWKASARRRKLMVKEFESEVSLSIYTLLDIGASMRWGQDGERPLDAGVDLALHLARAVSPGRDRYGLVTFDHEVFGLTRAGTGHGTSHQIAAHLMEVNAVVQEGFTEAMTRAQLAARVAQYIKVQEGLDLALPDLGLAGLGLSGPGPLGPWDESAVVSHAEAWLGDHADELKPLAHYVGPPAHDPAEAALRTFCRLRCIDLPYRLDAVPAARQVGIERAIQKAIEDRGGPHMLIVVTDLVGIESADLLIPVVRLARIHRHRLVFVVPEPPALQQTDELPQLERELGDLLSDAGTRRRHRIAAGLRRQGVVVHHTADPAALLRGARTAQTKPGKRLGGRPGRMGGA
jgi:uncharacterized protein (DUF58 family)